MSQLIQLRKDSSLPEIESGINAVLEGLKYYIEDAEKRRTNKKDDFYLAKSITFELAYDLVVSRLEFLFEDKDDEEEEKE